ncbi:hypothetical protein KX928_13475 [Roseobacter sp. YSTF-M11]|uniref:Uncharacterized protein n=1 Tax=Roseobacter insulae TaxID=2859783 RepID=A0A9X1K126_9RHOB|nr:hypothetical protein [Roseobacter insulae]MBW4708794.1 hypothetical protein [Roseobacter insulae]
MVGQFLSRIKAPITLMLSSLAGPVLAGLALLVAATAVGIAPVSKLIRVYEARHDLKQGSAGWIRSISGWSVIALWLLTTWFLATIIGDWAASGDLPGAVDRSWYRLQILIEIAAAILDADP